LPWSSLSLASHNVMADVSLRMVPELIEQKTIALYPGFGVRTNLLSANGSPPKNRGVINAKYL
jgi:hypothetical protein